MRPKTVILTLVVTLGLVVLVVALKGMLGTDSGNNSAIAPSTEANQAAPSAVEPQLDTNAPPASEEARAAQVQNELDQINALIVGGQNPSTTSMLLAKLSHPEAEVRKAAVDALVDLNDTNAIPAMEQAVAGVQDPREKVAMLDALAYLKLPSITDGLPDQAPNVGPNTATKARKAPANRRLDPGKKSWRTVPRGFESPGPSNPGQPQPATPASEPQQAQ